MMLRECVDIIIAHDNAVQQLFHIRKHSFLLIAHVFDDLMRVFIIEFQYELGQTVTLVKCLDQFFSHRRQAEFYVISM